MSSTPLRTSAEDLPLVDGGGNGEDLTGPHPHPLYRSAALQHAPLTQETAARRPVSLGLLGWICGGLLAMAAGGVAVDGHLRAARAECVAQHSVSAIAHPDLRAAAAADRAAACKEREQLRAEVRAVGLELRQLRDELRAALLALAPRRRR